MGKKQKEKNYRITQLPTWMWMVCPGIPEDRGRSFREIHLNTGKNLT